MLTKRQRRYVRFKRIIDFLIGGIAGIVLLPFMVIIAIAVKLDSPGPIMFKQTRIGKGKEHFQILKFRTMRIDTPKNMPTHLLQNPEQYITRTGKILRKFSLDELPQIYQCITGKLSLVGPRPALWNQDDLVQEREKYGANDILPGITGWAQINGRDELEIDEKAKLDGQYVQNISLGMDLKCLIGTVISVVKADGVVEGGTGNKAEKNQEDECHEKDLDNRSE